MAFAIISLRERGRAASGRLCNRHVVRQRPGAGHLDSVAEDLQQDRGPDLRIVAVDDGVHESLAEDMFGHEGQVLAIEPLIALSAPEALKPPHRAIHLILEPALRLAHADRLGGPIKSGVPGTLHVHAERVRVPLRPPAEHHEAVESGTKDAVQLRAYRRVAEVVVRARLRVVVLLNALRLHEGLERLHVDLAGGGRGDDLLLGEHEPEGVEQVLQLGGRRSYRRAAPPNPEAAIVAEGLEAAMMPRHLHPVHPTRGTLVPVAFGGQWLATPVLEEAGEPLLHRFRILGHANDGTRIVYADDEQSAVSVAKRTESLGDRAEVPHSALEFGGCGLARLDALPYVLPAHLGTPSGPECGPGS